MLTELMEKQDTFRTIGDDQGSNLQQNNDMSFILSSAANLKNIRREEIKNYIAFRSDDSFPEDELADCLKRTATPERTGSHPVFVTSSIQLKEQFTSLQKWEGVVEEVKSDYFVARLVDLTEPNQDEEAEFALDDVPEADRPLIAPGAIFYWNIGYLDNRHGQRYRASLIRFRRLPAWTEDEIKASREEAERIANALGWK